LADRSAQAARNQGKRRWLDKFEQNRLGFQDAKASGDGSTFVTLVKR
jgi:hypothetical protein